jgi:chitodextrinase
VPSGVVCPFCYQRINPSQLWYQCLGRNGTCKKAVDPERERLTKSRLETYPSFPWREGMPRNPPCPFCAGRPNLRACPQCHTALPVHFDESDVAILGLVGSRGSGKTVLMTVLVRELRDEIGKRFQASISLATENPDGLAGEDDYGVNREDKLYKQRVLPDPTAVVGAGREHSASVLLRWWQQGRGLFGFSPRSTMLAFVDSAGEQASSLTAAFTLEYLEACDGLIILLDPFALPGARAALSLPSAAINVDDHRPLKVVETITEKLRVELDLRMRQKIRIPAAVVFTKMDAFFPLLDRSSPLMSKAPRLNAYNDEDGQRVHEQMRSLLHRWGGQDIDAQISGHYRDFRYFGVSALGAEPDYPRYEVDPGGVRPHRVEDPVLWLLSKKGVVRKVAAGSRPPPVRPPTILPGRRWALLIGAAAAVVAVGAGVGALLAASPWVHPPVLRPTGLAVGATSTASLSIDWSGPSTGPVPDKYEILRDGHRVSSVSGATTRYTDMGLAPATAYTYRVVAVRGGKVSPASAVLSARTATPPVSAGVLDWNGTVDYQVGDLSNIAWNESQTWTDSWAFAPACQTSKCAIKLNGAFDNYDFTATLEPSSAPGTYTGTAPLNNFWTCQPNGSGQSYQSDSTLTITVKVTGAGVIDKQWVAKSFEATVDAAVDANDSGGCDSGTADTQVTSA